MCRLPSVLTRSAGVVGFVSWALVLATLDTKEKTVKKLTVWTLDVPIMVCASMGNVTAIQDGVVTTVKYSRPCVQTSALGMGHIFRKVAPVLVTLIGLAQIAQMKSALWTAAPTVFAWGALVAVKRAGRVHRVTREPATRAVPSMGPARTASANAARAGTESTAPSRVAPVCATATEDVRWTKMAGTVFASPDGEERDAM